MGRAAAVVFASEGASVFGSDVNAALQGETEEIVRKAGGTISSLAPVDLATEASAEAWVAASIAEYGRIDIVSTTPRGYDRPRSASSRSRTGRSRLAMSSTCRSYARRQSGRICSRVAEEWSSMSVR
jgi:hypothetical protein